MTRQATARAECGACRRGGKHRCRDDDRVDRRLDDAAFASLTQLPPKPWLVAGVSVFDDPPQRIPLSR